jgi:hypothetical protein
MATYFILDEHVMNLLLMKVHELSVEWQLGDRDDVERRKDVGHAINTLLSLAVPVEVEQARLKELTSSN